MAPRTFLLQMAGWMGSGKSTLAKVISERTGAAILDHDTTKSALLIAGIPHPPAGGASYEVLFALAGDLLAQDLPVIIDSPSAYVEIPERGLRLAADARVPYFFIECECDERLGAARVTARRSRPSQIATADAAAELRAAPDRDLHRPERGVLMVDTGRALDECIRDVVAYLDGPGAS